MKKLTIHFLPMLLILITGIAYAAMESKTLLDQGMEAFRSGNYGSAELVFKKIKESGEKEYD